MTILKQYNSTTQTWDAVAVGPQGPSGTIAVNAPLVNTGTSNAAVIGLQASPTVSDSITVSGGQGLINAYSSSAASGNRYSRFSNYADGNMVISRLNDDTSYKQNVLVHYPTTNITELSTKVTKPSQPSFTARSDQATTNGNDIVWNIADSNVGSSYNSTNGRFTAPVAGYYFFHAHGLWGNPDSGDRRIALYKNGAGFPGMRFITYKTANVWWTWMIDGVVYMAAGDYATVRVEASSYGMHTDANYNQFSGYLLG